MLLGSTVNAVQEAYVSGSAHDEMSACRLGRQVKAEVGMAEPAWLPPAVTPACVPMLPEVAVVVFGPIPTA